VKTALKEESVIKAVIDGRKYPPHFYRLENDTREWVQQCVKRRMLALQLASYANPDGSGISVGVDRLSQELGTHRATIFRWLDDLTKCGVLSDDRDDEGRARSGQHGTRLRKIDFSVFERPSDESKSQTEPVLEVANSSSKSQTRLSKSQTQVLEVSNSTLEVANSRLEVARMGATQPLQPLQPTTTTVRTAPPKAQSVKALCGVFSKTSGYVPKFKKGEKQDLAEMIIGHDPALLDAAITYYANNPPPGQNADTIYTMSGFVDGFEKYLRDARERLERDAKAREERAKKVERMLQDPKFRARWESTPESGRDGLLNKYQDERQELHIGNINWRDRYPFGFSERFQATLNAEERAIVALSRRDTDKEPFTSLDEFCEARNKLNALAKRGKAWDEANPEPDFVEWYAERAVAA